MGRMGTRVEPSITGIPFVNLQNSRLPNQWNKNHRHRQKCWLNATQEKTNNSNIKVTWAKHEHP